MICAGKLAGKNKYFKKTKAVFTSILSQMKLMNEKNSTES